MDLTVGRLAAALGAEALGDASLPLRGAAEPAAAGPDDLAVALSPHWAEALGRGRARAALLWPGADWRALGLQAAIVAPRGRLAMARLTQALDQEEWPEGVHPSAVVDPSAHLGSGVSVGPLAVVGAGARLGAGTRLGAQVTVSPGVVVGEGGLIHPGVRLQRRVTIGARAILQPGAVIGGDGFSFVTAEPALLETARHTAGVGVEPPGGDPTWHRIHSLGGVEIGCDVEVGANSTIDAGTIRATRVGDGTKIDNLVQIGHNVVIGRHCLLCGHVGVAGSTRIGDRVVLAGGVGVADNLAIGDDAVVTAGSGVLSNVAPGRVMMGTPATRMDQQIAIYKALRRLPRLLGRLAGGVPKDGGSD